MPGPASHLTIIELQTGRVQNNPQDFGGPVLTALANHPKHASLGAIGPDMIFWADWGEYTPVAMILCNLVAILLCSPLRILVDVAVG